ncbi:MAG: DUF4990 domain-containing protein [Bacteroidales bacterium]|nr:DUF4990 domain-containing protein [Bacteroidales bacterium]
MNRKIFILLFFILTGSSLSGATYYISPNGYDANPGTISQPFFSLNKAWAVVAAGDIIYVRGGTYYYTSQQRLIGKKGTDGNLIKVWAYPGETPVITRADTWNWSNYRAGIYFIGDYCHFKGLIITGFDQRDEFVWTAMRCEDFNNNIFEFIDFSWSGLGSYMTGACNNNLFLNCDWHDNYDPLSSYENADGLNFEEVRSGSINTLRCCRFWNNADDGLDVYNNDSYLLIENCWAWHQGYREDESTVGGDGSGFKLGPTSVSAKSTILRRVVNCISYKNQAWGYNENGEALCNMELYNNISYNNSFGDNWGGGYHMNVSGVSYYIKNNISYMDVPDAADLGTYTNINNNSWDSDVAVSENDFLSTDGAELALPRKADGSLPVITFLHLAEGSDLIEAGENIGLSFSGDSPDLGPYEYQSGAIVTPIPAYVSSVVQNSAPSIVELTFNLMLNSFIVPDVSAFNVQVNSQNRTVKSVSISGTKVRLTLSSGVAFGNIITVSYTKPTSNPLQTAAKGEAANFAPRGVTNNCIDPNGPNNLPVVLFNNPEDCYSGFINVIDASLTYDNDNDVLTYTWSAPDNVAIAPAGDKLQFLAPVVSSPESVEFSLSVSDGKVTTSESLPVIINPYKPELEQARIKEIEASAYQSSYYPRNSSDGDLSTKWSALGDNQWILFQLAKPFKINHLLIAFLPGQNASYTFDIFASPDNQVWDPVLSGLKSWLYSGNPQVFNLPQFSLNKDYSFVKFVGHGNTADNLSNISELKIYGFVQRNFTSGEDGNRKVIIYPDPAQSYFNVSIEEPTLHPNKIRLIDLTGKIVLEDKLETSMKNIQVPSRISSGIYLVQLLSDYLIIFAQKILVLH